MLSREIMQERKDLQLCAKKSSFDVVGWLDKLFHRDTHEHDDIIIDQHQRAYNEQ